MQRPSFRPARQLVAGGILGMALVMPGVALAAEPSFATASTGGGTEETPSEQSSDGTVVMDPTFIAQPTPAPVGAVLSATGRPARTSPPTDTAGQRPASTSPQGLPIVLAVLATICLACARMPDARRR